VKSSEAVMRVMSICETGQRDVSGVRSRRKSFLGIASGRRPLSPLRAIPRRLIFLVGNALILVPTSRYELGAPYPKFSAMQGVPAISTCEPVFSYNL